MRYRIFRNGEHLKTANLIHDRTYGTLRERVNDAPYRIGNVEKLEVGDILYVGDTFFECRDLNGMIPFNDSRWLMAILSPTDPKVRGLYGKAVTAERAAALAK